MVIKRNNLFASNFSGKEFSQSQTLIKDDAGYYLDQFWSLKWL